MIDVGTIGKAVLDHIGLVGGVSGAVITLTAAVNKVKSYIEGDNRLAENAATIKRHANTHDTLREFLKRPDAPRSILMEGAGIVYYAVKDHSPSVLKFNMRNRHDVYMFQRILPWLDDPQRAYTLATASEAPDAHGKECQGECNEIHARAEKGWVRHRDREKDATIDEAMLREVESLVKSAEPSSALSEPCHIALKHTTPSNPSGDIIVMGVTDNFRQAFERAQGTRDFSVFRNEGDNGLFDKFLSVRRAMANSSPVPNTP